MRNKDGFTPREEAINIATGWIANAVRGRTGDLADVEPPHFRRAVEIQLRKLHNRLILMTNMAGHFLDEEPDREEMQ